MRKSLNAMKHIFANWKMYLDFDESCILANQLLSEPFDEEKVNLAFFPNFLAVSELVKIFRDTAVAVGAQTCAWTPKGAYTGAVSAHLLKQVGCAYVLVGHSERRYIFGESNEDTRKRLEAALDAGLTPILCIGETEEDLKEQKREYRLKKQLMKALDGLDLSGRPLFIAYEPVWAIGSGKSCQPSDADDVHGWIRTEVKQYTDAEIPVLYGGSVDYANVIEYLSRETVDGVLVGGASTKMETFLPLIRAAEQE